MVRRRRNKLLPAAVRLSVIALLTTTADDIENATWVVDECAFIMIRW